MRIILNPEKNWKIATYNEFSIHFVGAFSDWEQIFQIIRSHDEQKIKSFFNSINDFYAIIIEGDDFIFSATDHICSTPVYYANDAISNCAYSLLENTTPKRIHTNAVKELSLTGYCTGTQTLYEGIHMLQAGEAALLYKGHPPKIFKHYQYLPQRNFLDNKKQAKTELDNILNDIFKDLVRDLNGRTVLLPLSGGLDSRLVIAKLLEHGHKNIISFSYGTKGNGEAIIAKIIAHKLGVKWLYLPSKNPRKIYQSDIRKKFDLYVDGLSIVPSYLDFEALYTLSQRDDIPKDSVIINGQTGDFIAGAHIPHDLLDPNSTASMAFQCIAQKHYKQRLDLAVDTDVILQNLEGDINNLNQYRASSLFEFWEWKERQAKAVMVGQRGYDFFAYNWQLPLWDKRLVDFFLHLSPDLKKQRILMVEYLNDYDFRGIFTKEYPEIHTWPRGREWIKWLARACGILGGKKAKEECYSRLYYFSTYHNQFSMWKYKDFLRLRHKTNRFVGQAAIHWLTDKGIDVP